MSEWRKDPFSDRWVVMAPQRAARPYDFQWKVDRHDDAARCPFCAGHESQTPEPVLVLRDSESSDSSPWHVRVVPNRYPAVDAAHHPEYEVDDVLYECRDLPGRHEVIIESPDHEVGFLDLPPSRLALCFEAYRQRLAYYRALNPYRFGLVFKNVGPLGGASLEHPHSQLVVLAQVPAERLRQVEICRRWIASHGRCLFCQILEREEADRRRVIFSTPRFIACCPFASRFPYQVWIVRREHGSPFEDAESGELRELSECVRQVLDAQGREIGAAAYNLILHSSPFDSDDCKHYHWYVETFPRVAITAGFEWGSGYFINTVTPEDAAAAFRGGIAGKNCE